MNKESKKSLWIGIVLLPVWVLAQSGFLYFDTPHNFPFFETLFNFGESAAVFLAILVIGTWIIGLISVSLKKNPSKIAKVFLGMAVGITLLLIGNIILWLFYFPSDYTRVSQYIMYAPSTLFQWITYENFLAILPFHIVPNIIVFLITLNLGRTLNIPNHQDSS
jgi:hypothetical protein